MQNDNKALTRALVGIWAAFVTVAGTLSAFYPDFLDSNDGVPPVVWGTRETLLHLALYSYAVALWLVALRINPKKFRPVLLLILSLGPLGLVLLTVSAIRQEPIFEALLPLAMFNLIVGVPSVLAILLLLAPRDRPKPPHSGARRAA